MITGKDVFAAIGFMFCIIVLGAIFGTAVELWDEWRSNHD